MESRKSGRADHSGRNIWSGFLFGIGIAAFIDESIFHQLLHWHHFYDKSTTAVGLLSDGLFHAFSWFATIAGLFLFADLRRRKALWKLKWWGGILLGLGGFQLYDGTIQHKLLRIHQIRYYVNLLPYDLTWDILAAVMIVVGIVLINRAKGNSRKVGGTA